MLAVDTAVLGGIAYLLVAPPVGRLYRLVANTGLAVDAADIDDVEGVVDIVEEEVKDVDEEREEDDDGVIREDGVVGLRRKPSPPDGADEGKEIPLDEPTPPISRLDFPNPPMLDPDDSSVDDVESDITGLLLLILLVLLPFAPDFQDKKSELELELKLELGTVLEIVLGDEPPSSSSSDQADLGLASFILILELLSNLSETPFIVRPPVAGEKSSLSLSSLFFLLS